MRLWVSLTCLSWVLLCEPQSVCAANVTDQIGRQVVFEEPLSRVVSLAPNLTEMSYLVGGAQVLVGATQYANHPEEAKRLPRVGSYVALDIEKIVSLRPQLCLAIRDGNPKAAVEKIEALGIPVYVFDPHSLEEIIDVVDRLGEIYGTEDIAQNLIKSYRSRLERIDTRASGLTVRPRVFFQIDVHPIISAGSDTFIHELIGRAGGINVAEDRYGYPRFSWEELLSLNPEVVLLASMGGGHSEQDLRAQWQQWPEVTAVRQNQLHVVDADLFSRPTPRLIDALDYLIDLLHPNGSDRKKQ